MSFRFCLKLKALGIKIETGLVQKHLKVLRNCYVFCRKHMDELTEQVSENIIADTMETCSKAKKSKKAM